MQRVCHICPVYLAAKGAEAKGIKKRSAANLASVGDTFTRPWLRPLVQEHNLCAVYYVCLHNCYVYVLLNLAHSHHVMVRRSSYLISTVIESQPFFFCFNFKIKISISISIKKQELNDLD